MKAPPKSSAWSSPAGRELNEAESSFVKQNWQRVRREQQRTNERNEANVLLRKASKGGIKAFLNKDAAAYENGKLWCTFAKADVHKTRPLAAAAPFQRELFILAAGQNLIKSAAGRFAPEFSILYFQFSIITPPALNLSCTVASASASRASRRAWSGTACLK